MTLSAAFNSEYEATRENDYVLCLRYGMRAGTVYHVYDFMTRVMMSRTGEGSGGVSVVPFSQLDPEVLATMHQTLVELKGNPPPLPGEPTTAGPGKKELSL
jgi:hypothetical protein